MSGRICFQHFFMELPYALEFEFIFHEGFEDPFIDFQGRDLLFRGGFKILVVIRNYGKALAEIIEVLLKVFYLLPFFRDRFRWFHRSYFPFTLFQRIKCSNLPVGLGIFYVLLFRSFPAYTHCP